MEAASWLFILVMSATGTSLYWKLQADTLDVGEPRTMMGQTIQSIRMCIVFASRVHFTILRGAINKILSNVFNCNIGSVSRA